MEYVKIEFHGQTIEAVWQNDHVWVAVTRICENLGLQPHNQRKKIKENQAYEGRGTDISLPSSGGLQQTFCLRLDALTLWLGSISASKVKAEIRPRLIQYQRECMEVLMNHFFEWGDAEEKVSGESSGTPPTPSVPSTPPMTPAEQLLASAQMLVEHERKLKELDFRMSDVEQRTYAIFKAMVYPYDPPPPKRLRDLIGEVVSRAAKGEKGKYGAYWNTLYHEFKVRFKVDLKARARKRNSCPLDVAEADEKLLDLYNMARYLWPDYSDLPHLHSLPLPPQLA